MENDKIYGWNLILSEFLLHGSQPLTGSVQKTFVGTCDFSVVWDYKYQGGVELCSCRISWLIYSINDQSWSLNILNIMHSLYEDSGKKEFCQCFIQKDVLQLLCTYVSITTFQVSSFQPCSTVNNLDVEFRNLLIFPSKSYCRRSHQR